MIVDLHVHSKYSRATSKDLDLAGIYWWAKVKGIQVIGTGDFTHPVWLRELAENLVEAEGGLYRLREELAREVDKQVPESCREAKVRWVPTVEISTIYSRHNKLRKVHSVVMMPSLEKAADLNQKLGKIGNLAVDGRPTLGLDTEELLKTVLEVSEQGLLIPAHVWTPWFGVFGSKSGFDSLEEAFGENAKYIYALETGLSSDPRMNWKLSRNDRVTMVSHSDAHSPRKLGREANVIDGELSYEQILGAIKTGDDRFVGTIEFFPEEGKYHLDGHRKCGERLTPVQTRELGGTCPQCGRQVVAGVMNRVERLADREKVRDIKKLEYIFPLSEVIAEIEGVKSDTSKRAVAEYGKVIGVLGNEFFILREIEVEKIRDAGFPVLAEAIGRMRAGKVVIEPGYDGKYGVVRVFDEGEVEKLQENQIGLF